jgi:hypothetical protein
MVEAMLGIFETQVAWLLSPLGIGILVGGVVMIGSGLLGRIVLFVERELLIRNNRQRRRSADEAATFLRAAAEEIARKQQAA